MILGGKNRTFFVSESFQCIIIQIDMRYFNIFPCQAIRVHSKSMILRCYFNSSCQKIFYRLIGAPVTELEFKGFAPQCKSQKLMPEANAK